MALGADAVRVDEAAPNYLTPGIDARCQEGIQFFCHRGYQETGRAVNMQIDLTNNPCLAAQLAGPALEGIEIRRAEPNDVSVLAEFLSQHWPSWQAEVDAAMRNQPATLYVAFEGGELLGFSAFEANNRGTGWFGPMGTSPAARGKGIGRHLLIECLADMVQQGFTTATIPWVGPTDFYTHIADAKLSREFVRLEKTLSLNR